MQYFLLLFFHKRVAFLGSFGIILCTFCLGFGQNYTPGGLDATQLQLWLDAQIGITIQNNTASGGTALDVSNWADQTGKGGRNASQATIANMPTWIPNALNGQAVLRFNGTSQYLTIPAINDLSNQDEFTAFVVAKSNTTSNDDIFFRSDYANQTKFWGMLASYFVGDFINYFLFQSRNTTGNIGAGQEVNFIPGLTFPAYTLLSGILPTSNFIQLFVNSNVGGGLGPNPDLIPTTHLGMGIGADLDGSNPLEGDMAEIIIFTGTLNTIQRIIIENYLEAKYGGASTNIFDLANGNDHYAQPDNQSYIKGVAGIGRAAGTSQTTAKSVGLQIESGVGSTDFLRNDNDFLFWGYQSATNAVIRTEIPDNASNRWQRDWFLDFTESGGEYGKITMRFDFSEASILEIPFGAYVLLYRANLLDDFQAIAYSQTIENTDQVVFELETQNLTDGYYTIGRYKRQAGSGNAFVFDGVNQRIEIPHQSNISPTGDYTLEFWFKPVANTAGVILLKNGEYGVRWVNDSSPIDFDDNGAIPTNRTHWTLNRWYHLAMRKSGTEIRLYIDGELEKVSTGNTHNLLNASLNIASNGSGGEFWQGEIDEIRLWNTARTATQIRDNVTAKVQPQNEADLVAYFDMDDQVILGQRLIWDKKNNQRGVLFNTPTFLTSGAKIGDFASVSNAGVSTFEWVNPTGETDKLSVQMTNAFTNPPQAIHIYYVANQANLTTPPSGSPTITNLDLSRYWGVYIIGDEPYTYTATYTYDGNSNINFDSDLELIYRADNSATSWTRADGVNVVFTRDTPNKTVMMSGLSGTEIMLAGGEGSLPITLRSFDVQKMNETSVKIVWQTVTEIHNQMFEIERAGSDWVFEKIGSVEGAGNSNQLRNYQFIDYQPLMGESYYRLKQIDTNGTFSYSPVKWIKFEEDFDVIAYPNPALETLNLFFPPNLSGFADLKLIDMTSKVIMQQKLDVSEVRQQKIRLENISSGFYFLKIHYQNKQFIQKFLKR